MEGKKRYIAIILFILLGLTVFTFANPDEEFEEVGVGGNNNQQEVIDNDTDNDDVLLEDNGNEDEDDNNNNVYYQLTEDNSYELALAAVKKVEKSLTEKDLKEALELVRDVTDSDDREELRDRLNDVEDSIDAIALVEKLEKLFNEDKTEADLTDSRTFRTEEEVQKVVDELKTKSVKDDLVKRLNELARVLDDESKPVVSGVPEKVTNQDVTLTVEDETEVTKIVTLNGETIEYSDTFTESGVYVIKFVDEAFNEQEVTFTIDKIFNAPVITYSDTDATNDDVVATITFDEVVESIEGYTADESGKVYTKTFITNGKDEITVSDLAGNTQNIVVTVENIDKVAPKFTTLRMLGGTAVKANGKQIWYANKDDMIYVYMTFEEKLATNPKVTINDELTLTAYEIDPNKHGYQYMIKHKLDENSPLKDGPITIKVHGYADAVGNVGKELTAKDITTPGQAAITVDRTFNTAVVEYSETNPTNKDVVVTITFDEAVSGLTGYTADASNKVFTKTYIVNTTEILTATDIAGNTQNIVVTIENIDKVAPKYTTLRMLGQQYDQSTGKTIWYANENDIIYVYMTFDEKLATNPKVTINDELTLTAYEIAPNKNGYQYMIKHKLDNDSPLKDGPITIKVHGYADAVGNVGKELTNKDITNPGQAAITVDRTFNTAVVEYSETNPTNGDVVVTITFDEAVSGLAGYTADANKKVFTKTYTVNTTETLTATDIAGNTQNVVVTVENIDKVAPKFTTLRMLGGTAVKANGKQIWYANKDDMIYVYMTFEEKLATNPKVTINDELTLTAYEIDPNKHGYQYMIEHKLNNNSPLKDGPITIKVHGYADAAGNVGKELTAKDITTPGQAAITVDRTFNKAVVEYSETNPTNGDVVVTITLDEAVSGLIGYTADASKKVFTKTYTVNTTETLTAKDIAGNTQNIVVTVENIDKEAPEYTKLRMLGGQYDQSTGKTIWYVNQNDEIKVYVTFKEKLVTNAHVTINGEVTVPANYETKDANGYVYLAKHKLDENSPLKDGPITIKVHGYADALGNLGSELTNKDITTPGQAAITVDRTFNTAVVEYSETNLTNKDVVVTITFDEAVSGLTGYTADANKKVFTKSYKVNTTETLTAKDIAGNKQTIAINVNNIDKTAPVVTGLEGAPFVYDGVGVVATSADSDINFVELRFNDAVVSGYTLGDAIVNAGEYQLKVVDNVSNETTIDFKINKYTPTITMIPETGTSFVYDGTAKNVSAVLNKVNGTESLVVVYKDADNNVLASAPKNAGVYTATASFEGNENYNDVSLTISFEITKATQYVKFYDYSNNEVENGKTYEYNGSSRKLTAKLFDKNNNLIKSLDVTTNVENPKNVGVYTASVDYTADSNHQLSGDTEIQYEIVKRKVKVNFIPSQEDLGNDNVYEYDGKTKSYTATLTNTNGFVLSDLSVNYSSEIFGNTYYRRNADVYTVSVNYIPDSNHELISDTEMSFEIVKRNVYVRFSANQLDLNNDNIYEYDGKAKSYSAILEDGNGNKISDLVVSDGAFSGRKNAGEYTSIADVTFLDTKNNQLMNSNKLEFVIKKATLNIVLDDEPKYGKLGYEVYNSEGTKLDINADLTYRRDGHIAVSMILDGRYDVTATIDETSNYYSATAEKTIIKR